MSDERPVIAWTRPMLERFKQAYTIAKAVKASSFLFDGHEFACKDKEDYAKYLIEFLETKV